MAQSSRPPTGVIVIIAFHLISLVSWFFGQTLAVVDYDMVAEWGLQEPRALVDPAIVQVNRAIGLTDTIVMLPFFLVAAIGLWRMRFIGAVVSWIVFGMSLYWPTFFWVSDAFYARADIQNAPAPISYFLVTGAVFAIAVWASWHLYRIRALFR